jgi:hypothetical protein
MTAHPEELWITTGDVDVAWNGVVPDSPEGINDTEPHRETNEITSAVGHTALKEKELIPVGTQALGAEQYLG